MSQGGELRMGRRPQARTSSSWLEATGNAWSPWRGRPCGGFLVTGVLRAPPADRVYDGEIKRQACCARDAGGVQ